MTNNRRLYRSRTNRKVAGVCGGLAEYFNIDATLMRVLFVVLALLGGPGLLIYLVLWIVVPAESNAAYPTHPVVAEPRSSEPPRGM